MHRVSRVGRFWYAFIVGDSVVLALGSVLALVAAWVLVRAGDHAAAELALPLILAGTLAGSLLPTPTEP